MDNATLHSVLEEYPDRVADALEEYSLAEARASEAYSRAYLKKKEGTKLSIDDAKHHAELDPDYMEKRLEFIRAKVKHTRLTGKLLSARRMAEMIKFGL